MTGKMVSPYRKARGMSGFTVGRYLAARLEQIGLRHYFVVPGDYNLVLLDELLKNKSLEQVGCGNELNASYAAEGYARVNGCGAVVTTFNVGAFSALNGVAGANAERLPVMFVSSGINTNDPGANHLLHHTIGTHDFSYQYEMFRRVTCAAVRILHAENAPSMIDHAISTALRERKHAYIEIACNLSDAPCPQPAPYEALLAWETSNAHALAAAVERARVFLAQAGRPLLLAGVHLRAFGAIEAFRELAEALGCGVAVMPNAKGFFPEDHPQYVGIYWGGISSPGCEAHYRLVGCDPGRSPLGRCSLTTPRSGGRPCRNRTASSPPSRGTCGCPAPNSPTWRWPSSCPLWGQERAAQRGDPPYAAPKTATTAAPDPAHRPGPRTRIRGLPSRLPRNVPLSDLPRRASHPIGAEHDVFTGCCRFSFEMLVGVGLLRRTTQWRGKPNTMDG